MRCEKANVRNMFNVHRFKKGLITLLMLVPFLSKAQMNVTEYENRFSIRPYHFGISLGYNSTDFRIAFADQFIGHDSVMQVLSTPGPGFNLGILTNLRMGKYFDLRFIPTLSFAEKTLNYTYRNESTSTQTVESLYLCMPFDVKFKSAAYKDMKVYVLGGMQYTYDFSSNAEARNAEGLVKIKPNDIAVNAGFGFEFYFPYFIFCPEIKLSNGIVNIHAVDPLLQESYVMDKLLSRTLLFCIHIEG